RARREPAPASFDPWCLAEMLVQRWRWLVLGACAVAVLAMAAGLFAWKKSYTAVAQLMRYEPIATGDFFKPQTLTPDTFSGLLKSPELLDRVSAIFHPAVSPNVLAKSVFIKTEPDSDLVKVAVKGRSPQFVVELANLYAWESVRFTLDLQRKEAEAVNKTYLKKRLEQMNADLQTLESEFRGLPQSGLLTSKVKQIGGTVTNLSQQLQTSLRPSMATARMTEKL